MNKKFLPTLFAIILSFTFFLPTLAPRAHAFLGIGDFTIVFNPTEWSKTVQDIAGQVVAQKMIDSIVRSTINWANSGFQGNPAYVTDPKAYFGKITSGTIGSIIANDSNFGFLCSPFQATIRASLVRQYFPEPQYQCTLEQIGVNVDNFYKNFSSGGWNGWFQLTQGGSSPYESYFEIKDDIDNKLANELSLAQQDLQINSGFLSYKKCEVTNPDIPEDAKKQYQNGEISQSYMESTFGQFDLSQPAGACLQYGPVTTPGEVIKSQLDNVLPSGLNKLITAQTLDQLASAFATGLLQKYVFNSSKGGGLFTGSNGGDTTGASGGTSSTGGVGTTQSSLVCDATNTSTQNVNDYVTFLNNNAYDSNSSPQWSDEVIGVNSNFALFIKAVQDLSIPSYNTTLTSLNAFSTDLENTFESLVTNPTNLSSGTLCLNNNACSQARLAKNASSMLDYLKQFQAVVTKNCSDPDLNSLSNIPAPEIDLTGATVVNNYPTGFVTPR